MFVPVSGTVSHHFVHHSSFIQLPDGHEIPWIRENEAMVRNATLLDRRDMTWDLVAPAVPTDVPAAVEMRDEEMREASFERLTRSPYRSPILPLFAMIKCLVTSDGKPGGVLVVTKGAPRTFRSMRVGRTRRKRRTSCCERDWT